MATDAIKMLDNAVSQKLVVNTAKTAMGGMLVKYDGDDFKIEAASANDFDAIGIAHYQNKSYVAGDTVEVFKSGGIIPVKVGTGGATRGKQARFVADGFTDAPAAAAAGATTIPIFGEFVQSGVAGDFVGLHLHRSERIIA